MGGYEKVVVAVAIFVVGQLGALIWLLATMRNNILHVVAKVDNLTEQVAKLLKAQSEMGGNARVAHSVASETRRRVEKLEEEEDCP